MLDCLPQGPAIHGVCFSGGSSLVHRTLLSVSLCATARREREMHLLISLAFLAAFCMFFLILLLESRGFLFPPNAVQGLSTCQTSRDWIPGQVRISLWS